MDKFRFFAFMEEFPFLSEVAGGGALDCDEITVKRITTELLAWTPSYSGATGNKVGINKEQKVHFVFKSATTETEGGLVLVKDAVRSKGHCIHHEAHQDNESWSGETVLEALFDLDLDVGRLAFIVCVHTGYVVRDHYSQQNWRATIYKPAKNVNVAEYIDQAVLAASALVKAEANF